MNGNLCSVDYDGLRAQTSLKKDLKRQATLKHPVHEVIVDFQSRSEIGVLHFVDPMSLLPNAMLSNR